MREDVNGSRPVVRWPEWRWPCGALVARYRKLAENVRLILTALIGAAIGYVTYEIVFFVNPFEPRAPVSWLVAFAISVPRQHALHRWLTFGEAYSYWPSLARAYVFYTTVAAATTGADWFLVEALGWPHRLAWLACIGLTGLSSWLLLKRTVFVPR